MAVDNTENSLSEKRARVRSRGQTFSVLSAPATG